MLVFFSQSVISNITEPELYASPKLFAVLVPKFTVQKQAPYWKIMETMFKREKYSNFMIISHTILTKILLPTQKCSLYSGAAYTWTIFRNFQTQKWEPAAAPSRAEAHMTPATGRRCQSQPMIFLCIFFGAFSLVQLRGCSAPCSPAQLSGCPGPRPPEQLPGSPPSQAAEQLSTRLSGCPALHLPKWLPCSPPAQAA